MHVNLDTGYVIITDPGARRIAFERSSPCKARGRLRVVCDAIDSVISLELRDRDDSATFAPGLDPPRKRVTNPLRLAADYEDDDQGELTETAWIEGGDGDDRISGTSEDDYLDGGRGVDRVDGRGAAGEYFFEFPCPKRTAGCSGAIALESPPTGAQPQPPVSYGAREFTAASGERAYVGVALTPEGRAAGEAGSPVAVHVTAAANRASAGESQLDFGWQLILPR